MSDDGLAEEMTAVHAPTLTVSLLRQAASVVATAARQLPRETIYFPQRENGERQPIELRGHVALPDISGLLHYIADMLEA